MLANLKPIDKISLFALGKNIGKAEAVTSIADLAEKYHVPLMSESRHRDIILTKLLSPAEQPPGEPLPSYIKTIVAELMARSHAKSKNTQRASYAPWFKALITRIKHEYKIDYKSLSRASWHQRRHTHGLSFFSAPNSIC